MSKSRPLDRYARALQQVITDNDLDPDGEMVDCHVSSELREYIVDQGLDPDYELKLLYQGDWQPPEDKEEKFDYNNMIDDPTTPWWIFIESHNTIYEGVLVDKCKFIARDHEGTILQASATELITNDGTSPVMMML